MNDVENIMSHKDKENCTHFAHRVANKFSVDRHRIESMMDFTIIV